MPKHLTPYFLILLLAFCFSTPQLLAQNPGVVDILEPGPDLLANQSTPITVLVENSGDLPVNNPTVQIDVFDMDMNLVFTWSTMIPSLIPGESIPVSTLPDAWYPILPGPYTINALIIGEPDTDPTNNELVLDVFANPQPPTNLMQVDMVRPYNIPNSMWGRVCFDVPPLTDPMFANIMAVDPGGTSPPEWIVQNMFFLPFDNSQTLCYWFDLSLLGFEEADDVFTLDYAARFDPVSLDQPFPVSQWIPIPVADYTYDVHSGNFDPIPHAVPIAYTYPGQYPEILGPWEYRGCTVPNIDLDSENHNPTNTPGYAGDINACGPAAAANSMQWLEDTHPLIPSTGTTHRQKMEGLSGHMDRADESGVNTEQLVKGKLGYIDEHQLPIHVKYQSDWVTDATIASPDSTYGHTAENKGSTTANKPPTWEFLKSEMEKGEDVEILFGWYDSLGTRHGGHWPVVTGYGETPAGKKGIYIKDDSNQDSLGGTSQTFLEWHTDGDWSRLVGYDGQNNVCWVESIVSESYDPTVTFGVLGMSLELFDWTDPSLPLNPLSGAFSFTFPPSPDVRFVNVLANLPDSTPFWLVRNVLLPPFPTHQEMSVRINFGHLGLLPGQSFDTVEVQIGIDSTFSVDSFFDIAYTIDMEKFTRPRHFGSGRSDLDTAGIIFTLPSYTPYDISLPISYVYRGCTVPNIDLDSLNHNPTNSPGYAGDKNACGPAAAANSLQWLENTHDDIDANGQTHREKMEELSGFMNRANNSTVTDRNFIRGKLAFIDKHKLPIHVKFQSSLEGTGNIASPDTLYGHSAENKNDSSRAQLNWDWLTSEMEKGEDVEMGIGFYDSTGASKGGHWITLSGLSQIGGARAIQYKDDGRQDTTGGMNQEWVDWVLDTNGVPYLSGMSGVSHTVRPEIVVSESYDPNITFDVLDMSLELFDWPDPFVAPNPLSGAFSFTFPPSPDVRFVNVLANLPDSTPFWLVRNVLLPPFPTHQEMSVRINFGHLGIIPGQSFDTVEVQIGVDSTFTVDSFFDITYTIDMEKFTRPMRFGSGRSDLDTVGITLTPPVYSIFDIDLPVSFVYRGCTVPNIDLDSMNHNPTNTPGYAGDKNACGPAAAANSLQWLENTNDDIPANGQTHREKMEELSGFMNRANNSTVTDRNFIKGKLAFIDKHKLPIHVKFQSALEGTNNVSSPDSLYGHTAENKNDSSRAQLNWDWLTSEMEKGEDVEMGIGFYDSTNTSKGGHWITLSGLSQIGGARSIQYKDDGWQDTTGGMNQEWVDWVLDSNGVPYLSGMSGVAHTVRPEIVVSESYDSTVTFCPKNIGTASDSLLRAAIACAKDGDTIFLRAVIGSDTIKLDSALVIDKNLTIISHGGVHISGDGTTRAFEVESGNTVVFDGFNIISGTSTEGSGIHNEGSLRLNDMNVIKGAGTPEGSHLVQNKSGGNLKIKGDTNVKGDD